MCEIYWAEDFEGKIARGEWKEEIKRKSVESRQGFIPFRDYKGKLIIESQEVTWKDCATGEERARLHRYITDDGSIGGSGHADPKRIRLSDGASFNLTRPTIQEPCSVCGRIGHGWE
jgi:hypothetical protein